MDFDQLLTFLEIAKQGSFSRAGQKLFRSQPAVSAQIRQLEQEYGEKLLDRVGKSVRLTPAGEVLLEYARNLVTLREESRRAVADHGDIPRGVLALGANEATCVYVLPDVFAEYSRLYPAVQISIYRNFSRKVLERVEDGTLDVGIVTLPVKSPILKVHSVFRDRIMLMVNAKSPLASRKSVTIDEIAKERLIFPRTGSTRQTLDKLFRPYKPHLKIAMELPSVVMIKRFVVEGLGVSLISSAFASEDADAGLVKLIEIEGVHIGRELGVVYRKDRSLPRAATAFIELVKKRRAASRGENSK